MITFNANYFVKRWRLIYQKFSSLQKVSDKLSLRGFVIESWSANSWLPCCSWIVIQGCHFVKNFHGCHDVIKSYLSHIWLPYCYYKLVSPFMVAMFILYLCNRFHGCHIVLVLRLVHSWLPCCCLIVLSISMVALQYCYKFLDSHSRVAMLLLNLVKNLYSNHVGFEFWLVYSWLPCCYLDMVRTFMVAMLL